MSPLENPDEAQPARAARRHPSRFGLAVATSLVVANMIGTGIFTALGLQAAVLSNATALLALWILGGLTALCGAICYAELGAALPESGGEYLFLRRIYHPLVGAAAGVISLIVGFAAPIALAAMAFGEYASRLVPIDSTALALGLVLGVGWIHAGNQHRGGRFQVMTTGVKVAILLVFCASTLFTGTTAGANFDLADAAREVQSPQFALSLLYVSYAYSGWNAAVYLSSEIPDAPRVVPRALLAGTIIVTALYVAFNAAILRVVPHAELAGAIDVASLAAPDLFGRWGDIAVSAAIALVLVSTVSAMTMAGPRVLISASRHVAGLAWFRERYDGRAPRRAVAVQLLLSVGFVVSGSFAQVLEFAGFLLIVNALLAALGVIVLRVREPRLERPFRVWAYPLPPLVFAAMNTWILIEVTRARPVTAAIAAATVALAFVLALASRR